MKLQKKWAKCTDLGAVKSECNCIFMTHKNDRHFNNKPIIYTVNKNH